MGKFIQYDVGDIVEFRKPHPCGNSLWEVMRTGVDFRIKCTKCLHQVMISRVKFERSLKRKISASNAHNDI